MFHGIELVLIGTPTNYDLTTTTMTLDEANLLIQACVDTMSARYGSTVFNEWAVLSLHEQSVHILKYSGPRKDDFQKNFAKDLDGLREDIESREFGVGDFAFARHGVGTGFEAFMILGPGLYLICNNTRTSMDAITKDPRWLGAQVPFVELSDKIRAHPLVPQT